MREFKQKASPHTLIYNIRSYTWYNRVVFVSFSSDYTTCNKIRLLQPCFHIYTCNVLRVLYFLFYSVCRGASMVCTQYTALAYACKRLQTILNKSFNAATHVGEN